MKIAIPSLDGTTMSPHFGRSTCFIVYETADSQVTGREVRTNSSTPHAQGQCNHSEGHHHGEHGHHGHHSHAGVVDALADCQVLLCRGLGHRAVQAFEAGGLKVFAVADDVTADEAAEKFLAGSLTLSNQFCRCGH